MGREWDRFRVDETLTQRHRGEHAGQQGALKAENDESNPAAGRVVYGGGNRPTTSRCALCGKRDQFRNAHEPTTGCGAVLEGVRFVGIEQDGYSVAVGRARLAWWSEHPEGVELVQRIEAERGRYELARAGQEALF